MKKSNIVKQNLLKDVSADKSKQQQNKDDLDSRTGEEQLIKGDNITNNKKEKKSENKK